MRRFAYTILIHPLDPDEGPGYWAEVPTLDGLTTHGDTIEHTIEMAREAITCWIGGSAKAGDPIPPSDPNPQIIVKQSAEVEAAA